jgi:hypothetical protein
MNCHPVPDRKGLGSFVLGHGQVLHCPGTQEARLTSPEGLADPAGRNEKPLGREDCRTTDRFRAVPARRLSAALAFMRWLVWGAPGPGGIIASLHRCMQRCNDATTSSRDAQAPRWP